MKVKELKASLALCFACTIWGVSGIFYKQLIHIPPLEILAHRSLWAMAFFSGYLFVTGSNFKILRNETNIRELILLNASALLISANWFLFIFAIQSGQATQASFGYYIFPLVAIILGFLFRGERFSSTQLLAIVLAAMSVVMLGFALKLVPSIALFISLTFGIYGLLKGFIKLSSIESVTLETILIAPISFGFLTFIYLSDQSSYNQLFGWDFFLLIMSGIITGGPLILFSYATKKLNYSTVGILQYLNPTLQFLVSILIFLEPFNIWHALALVCVWISILIYFVESLRLEVIR